MLALNAVCSALSGFSAQGRKLYTALNDKNNAEPDYKFLDLAVLLRREWIPVMVTAASKGCQSVTLDTPFHAPAGSEEERTRNFFEGSGFQVVEFGQIKNGFAFGPQYDLNFKLAWPQDDSASP
jgi:hypothetical protein